MFLHWQILEHLKEIGQMTNKHGMMVTIFSHWCNVNQNTRSCHYHLLDEEDYSPIPITKCWWGHSRLDYWNSLWENSFFFFKNDVASLANNLVICKEAELLPTSQFCYSTFSRVFRRNENVFKQKFWNKCVYIIPKLETF